MYVGIGTPAIENYDENQPIHQLPSMDWPLLLQWPQNKQSNYLKTLWGTLNHVELNETRKFSIIKVKIIVSIILFVMVLFVICLMAENNSSFLCIIAKEYILSLYSTALLTAHISSVTPSICICFHSRTGDKDTSSSFHVSNWLMDPPSWPCLFDT